MAYPDDLLNVAHDLAAMEPSNRASLRRSVSTAYYALFHLLIAEATANWARPELRATLSRFFDHGPMKQASKDRISQINATLQAKPGDAETNLLSQLHTVAHTFVQAQQRRHEADYDVAKEWTAHEVYTQIDSVRAAFLAWNTIRDEAAAQAYLVSLLGKERRSSESTEPKFRLAGSKERPGPKTAKN